MTSIMSIGETRLEDKRRFSLD